LTGETGRVRLTASAPHALGADLLAHEAPSQVTKLLQGWRAGERSASDALLPLVYDELRRLAHHHLRNERPHHTLQSTALVNEAYLRLVGQNLPKLENRAHFFAIAAQLMRQILVDYARRHRASKRGSGICLLELDDATALPQRKNVDVVALDDALNALAEIDPRQSRVVELRFFAGLSVEETSEVMGIATATVQRDWTAARAWLHREISRSSRT
jgi:RNA polymerase sigma factor (TIGR02999 family)